MDETDETVTVSRLLDRILEQNREGDRVRMAGVVEAVGRQSFGPLLLVPGLLALSPLTGIPGVPSLVGLMILLISGQLLVGRKQFWLPDFILRRSISRKRFEQTIRLARRGAPWVDRAIKPRLPVFVNGFVTYAIAGGCCMVALLAPLMELLPFAITGVGAVVTILGFGLFVRDGFLILLALLLLIGAIVGTGYVALF